MAKFPIPIKESERVEIITLVDNYVDLLLPDEGVVTRPPISTGKTMQPGTLLAEHGLALLVKVYQGEKNHTILFDTGYSRISLKNNMEQLGVDIQDIEAIVLSHFHMDHTGSLLTVIEDINKPVPVVAHPDVFLYPRYFGMNDGQNVLFPKTVTREDLSCRNATVVESKDPTLVADGTVAVSGQIERVIPFEKGLPNALAERNGKIEKDEMLDDQALIIRVKGKGLVIISGCSHAGIINTIQYAQKITQENNVHAVAGGFHLSGAHFEILIEDTIDEMKKINPAVLVPMHCTGWKAVKRISEEFRKAFVLNSVGSKITIE